MQFPENNSVPVQKWMYALQVWESNQYIDFQEASGGAEFTAEITPGWYCPDDLASAVATAMNAASGASGTYTCAFSRTLDKYTIVKASNEFLINACDDPSEWNASVASIVAATSSDYQKQGTARLLLGKDGITTTGFSYTHAPAAFNVPGSGYHAELYVTDPTDLKTSGTAVRLYMGQDAANNYYKDYTQAELVAGIQTIGGLISDFSTTGSPSTTGIAWIRILFYTDNNADTVALGRLAMDYFRATDPTDTLSILWNTGTNAASAAAATMSFSASGDDLFAASALAENVLTNRVIGTFPEQKVENDFPWIRKSFITDSGVQASNFRRQESSRKISMLYVREQELDSDWVPMMIDSGVARGYAVDYYPNSLDTDYVVCYIDAKRWKPKEMTPGLQRFYQFDIMMREKLPKAGTIQFKDLYTRTAPE